MAELPFGDNPFAQKIAPSQKVANERGLPLAPPILKAPPLNTIRHRKRSNQVVANDPGKGEASKKNKPTAGETPSAASLIMGDLAKDNFKDEDIVSWSKRGKAEAKFCFKQALGESFFHGLDLVDSLESENLKLQQALTNSKNSSDYYKGLLDGTEKKIEDLKDGHKAELKSLHDELDRFKGEATSASEALKKEVDQLKSEKASIQEGKDKELSDAFSLGFAAYLQNFLAADPEYNWAPHFPPSTPAYMIKFKEDNDVAIMVAKENLEARIASEKDVMANKGEEKGDDAQLNETTQVSPSNTVLS